MSGAQPGRSSALARPDEAAETLIGGRYLVECATPLPHAGGGLPAFAVRDRGGGRAGLMAVQVPAGLPPRPLLIGGLPEGDAALTPPLAHGAAPGPGGAAAWFVICPAPPGPPLWPAGQVAIRPWTEAELLTLLLRPAAAALESLRTRGITYRAIRPDNVFRAPGTDPAVLGCAWAAPPALHQPAAFEPPYVAMCLPAGRGEGSGADDIYALGATALALALGRMPWATLPDDEMIRRKLELGSFAALAGEARLPPLLAELLRGMLAEDPAQRPTAALLGEPDAARARRVAARPVRRAQRPLMIGSAAAWEGRTLALTIARDPLRGVRALRDGSVDQWIRRFLDDGSLAARLEEQTRRRLTDHAADDPSADAVLGMRAVAVLDPLAPLCWDGLALWPDGIGPALAAAEGGADSLAALVAADAPAVFAAMHGDAEPHSAARAQARNQRNLVQRRGWAGGVKRLRYALNPLLACRSAVLGGAIVARLPDLLPALEQAARGKPAGTLTLDADIVAFVAARQDHALDPLLNGFSEAPGALAPLTLLARLQTALRPGPLPHLAAALAAAARPALVPWRSAARQADKQRAAEAAAASGDLSALLAVLDDAAGRRADAAEAEAALAGVARIDAMLAALEGDAPGRTAAARALGQEIAGSLALAALAASGVAALLQ